MVHKVSWGGSSHDDDGDNSLRDDSGHNSYSGDGHGKGGECGCNADE